MKNETRYVIDSNVIISYFLFPLSTPGQMVSSILKDGTILMSHPIERELANVWGRKKFDQYVPYNKRYPTLTKFLRLTRFIEITEQVDICRDPKDNHILELALRAYLISLN